MANLNLLSPAKKKMHEEVLQYEDRGRAERTLAGSHIADLAHLMKTILLCDNCVGKFDAKRNGYVTDRTMPLCAARCDGCREMGMDRHVFLHSQNMPRL